MSMTPFEFTEYKKMHMQHARLELHNRTLQIWVKNVDAVEVDLFSLELNPDMTLHPLQAVDKIIDAFQLPNYTKKVEKGESGFI